MGFTVSVMKSGHAMMRQLETPLNEHGNLKEIQITFWFFLSFDSSDFRFSWEVSMMFVLYPLSFQRVKQSKIRSLKIAD